MEKFHFSKVKDYCLHCGLCIPFCERREEKENPSLCKECLFCYSICPRLHSPSVEEANELALGRYQKAWKVRSVERPKGVQDAGVVTLLVKHLLEEGIADSALLTRRNKDWYPEPFLATQLQEVEQASGTKYTVSPGLLCLKEGISKFRRLAVVGLPCQMAALQNLLRKGINERIEGKVIFRIGLFCMNSFIYGAPFPKGMRDVIEKDLGLPIQEVIKIEIQKGKLRIYSTGSQEPFVRSVKECGDIIWPICLFCSDFTCMFSDLSVGSVGSENLTNTVIIRTDEGSHLFDGLVKKGLIEAVELKDFSEIERIVEFKKSRRDKLSAEEKIFLGKKTIRGNWFNLLEKGNKGLDL